MAYEREKLSKESIRGELMALAEQVKFMEQTYRKEMTVNEKVKVELQRFMNKKEMPLK